MAIIANPRLPNAPTDYNQRSVQQIIRQIQSALDELQQRGISYDVQDTVGAAGPAAALPATPEGYANVIIDGQPYVMPYYKAQ